MPIQEIVTTLKNGEAVTIMGPGTLEFKAPKLAAVAAKTAGGAKGAAVAGGTATAAAGATTTGGMTTTTAMGKTAAVSGGAAAKSIPASLMSGKVLGLSLGAVNPWLLLGAGALGGYYYCKRKKFGFF
ncbi:MAG: hypothetical protein HQL72_03995 [Magnetococcales bacterium]|nr:hypothetical protein [Magnetococcales bacterium]